MLPGATLAEADFRLEEVRRLVADGPQALPALVARADRALYGATRARRL